MDTPSATAMHRTTVYLPRASVDRARVAARTRGVTVASLIRVALDSALGGYRPAPQGGFLSRAALGDAEPHASARVGEP